MGFAIIFLRSPQSAVRSPQSGGPRAAIVIKCCMLRRAMPAALWARWKRFAHRAAMIQSALLLGALYWVLVVPIGWARRSRWRRSGPHWRSRKGGTGSIDAARRQF